MHARKPGLRQLALPVGWPRPDVGSKWLAALVNRECLDCGLDRRMQAHVVVFVFVFVKHLPEESGRSQCAHRIPYSDEADRRARPRTLYVVERLCPFRRPRALVALITMVDFGYVVIV